MSCPFSKSESATPTIGADGQEKEPVYYHSYLKLDEVLQAQVPLSSLLSEQGGPAHEELLFIITHQTYELWFKQILHEIDSIKTMLKSPQVEEQMVQKMVHRLGRVKQIWKLLGEQFLVLETMTPQEFLAFRDFLHPASGFQSVQWRLIENKLGLESGQRLQYQRQEYTTALIDEHKDVVQGAEAETHLFALVEAWLERIPFLEEPSLGYEFWPLYVAAVNKGYDEDRDRVLQDDTKDEERKQELLAEVERGREQSMQGLQFEKHEELRAQGRKRLSFRATQAALLIYMYKDEPILQWPYQLIQSLCEVDEMMGNFRHRHAQMVHRMIGMKPGTGGSAGYMYLKSTVDRHRVFTDLFDLSTYLIPAENLPPLPEELKQQLGLAHTAPKSPAPKPSAE